MFTKLRVIYTVEGERQQLIWSEPVTGSQKNGIKMEDDQKEILSVKVHRYWDSTVPITYHMQDLRTCTACGTSLFTAKQVYNTDSPRRMWSPNSCDTLLALWTVPVPTGSGTSSVFNLHTQTHSKYRSDILMIILQQHRAPLYKYSNRKWSYGQPIRFKFLDGIHILQQTTHSLTHSLTHSFSLQWKSPT